MQASLLFALLAAAAVSAETGTVQIHTEVTDIKVEFDQPCKKPEYAKHPACEVVVSKTYEGKKLPKHRHYDCDATSEACYAPASYGKGYGGEHKEEKYGYKYGRSYPYPGPKVRFCKKMHKIKKGVGKAIHGIEKLIKGVIGGAVEIISKVWGLFVKKWNLWCAVVKSDWQRFKDWKECKDEEWKDWWEHYLDLCRTRKALWDDAMREFHRQWHHYKKCSDEEYKKKKESCKVKVAEYDEGKDYSEHVNYYGVTPVEKGYKDYPEYKPEEYKKTCDKKDEEYRKANPKDDYNAPDREYVKKVEAEVVVVKQ